MSVQTLRQGIFNASTKHFSFYFVLDRGTRFVKIFYRINDDIFLCREPK